MIVKKLLFIAVLIAHVSIFGQSMEINLAKKSFDPVNRTISLAAEEGAVKMNAKPGDGLGKISGVLFTKGVLEIDIKGKNEQGRSFVGLAFNIQNDSTYEVIYFRPFNFIAEEKIRKEHMVQYISHPEYTWRILRETRTGEFENEIANPPDPDEWFNARLEIDEISVKVYVNGSETPSLEVERLTEHKSDMIGIWTGFNSAGHFRNLKLGKL